MWNVGRLGEEREERFLTFVIDGMTGGGGKKMKRGWKEK